MLPAFLLVLSLVRVFPWLRFRGNSPEDEESVGEVTTSFMLCDAVVLNDEVDAEWLNGDRTIGA